MSAPSIVTRQNQPDKAFRAGTHKLTVCHTVKIGGGTQDSSSSIRAQEVELEVRLERFQPPEIAFRYPQPGSAANFSRTLPHVILGKAELPWERTSGGGQPWLALIAFAGKDRPEIVSGVVNDLTVPPPSKPGDPKDMRCLAALQGSTLPKAWEQAQTTPCRYIDIPWDVFKRLAPQAGELALLAHVQKTSSGGENPPPAQGSAVLLNHLPVASLLDGDGAAQGVPVDVHLVSFEGLGQFLPSADKDQTAPFARIRLLSLDQWNFTHVASLDAAEGSEFERLCRKLTPRVFAADDDPLSRQGYVRYDGGGRSLLYRSPLLPVPDGNYTPRSWETPDECLFTANDGKDADISYAAAWQMGRLAAMGDPNLGLVFARAREGWRYLDVTRGRNVIADWKEPVDTPEEELKLDRISRDDEAAGVRLERLWFLESVPLHYLVPDPARLPGESLCVVHLDRDWADAWCWGAFSAGSHAPSDFPLGCRDGMQLMEVGCQSQARIQGSMGLLIRSRIVPMWPSLVVDLRGKNGDGAFENAPIARRALLAPDVLLVLAAGGFSEVVLSLPVDGLSFQSENNKTRAPLAGRTGGAEVARAASMAAIPSFKFSLTEEPQ